MDHKSAYRLRSAARKSAAMPETNPQSGEDLANWLKEAAKRPWVDGPLSFERAVLPVASPQSGREPRARLHPQNGRDLVALAVLTIGYLQYYYLDVMVQIGNLHKVVVFVPLAVA